MSAGNDPGAMRKLPVYLGRVEDDDQDDDRYSDEYDESNGSAHVWSIRTGEPVSDGPDERELLEDLFGTVFDLAGQIASAIGPDEIGARLHRVLREVSLRITLHPRTYNEARTIGEHFREGTPVIINLTEMVDSDAKRLVDFSAGLIFGLRGSIERVASKVFLLSPADVEVTTEDKTQIAERGFFSQS